MYLVLKLSWFSYPMKLYTEKYCEMPKPDCHRFKSTVYKQALGNGHKHYSFSTSDTGFINVLPVAGAARTSLGLINN